MRSSLASVFKAETANPPPLAANSNEKSLLQLREEAHLFSAQTYDPTKPCPRDFWGP